MSRAPSPSLSERRAGDAGRLLAVDCHAGRGARPYPEQHGAWTVAVVRRGRFRYRDAGTNRTHGLHPGWMILGRSEAIYECSHDHDGGDECLALEFAPGVLEDVASSTPGCRGDIFPAPVLGPATRALALVERLAAPGHRGDFDEAVHAIASTVLTGAYQTRPPPAAPHASHRARVEAAIARIEARCAGPVKLAELASEARLSPFHFLRVFRSVTGTTPHQYVLGARLRRASRLLVETSRPVTRIALDVGFEDLSNFVRTFHRAVGCSPGAFRRRA